MLQERIVKILAELRDKPVNELVTYDLKLDWRFEASVDPWRLMCLYKKDKSPAGDCDVSLRSMVIYWLVFGFSDWRLCPDGRGNFQLEREGKGYAVRGDTMNSYATTAHAYFRMKELEGLRGDRTWYDAILADYEKFAPLYQGVFADFVKVCHTVGNMLPIPSGDLNRARGIGPMKDYFDLYVTWLHEYVRTSEKFGNPLCTGVIFTSEVFPGVGELIEFLGGYESWDSYVQKNYLEKFCCRWEQDGETHFSEGDPLWYRHRISHSVMPQTVEECESFFQNASQRILARGRRIIAAVKEKLADYESLGCSIEDLANRMLKTERVGKVEEAHEVVSSSFATRTKRGTT